MSSLLARAQADIDIAKLLLSPEGNPGNDEMITDQAAYHVQQGIEKAMKYQTEMMGIEYKKTHNLVGLIADLEKNGFVVSDKLKEKSFIISDWEASSRYKDDFCAVKKDIEEAIVLYEELKDKILLELEKNTKRVYSDEK
ncbi:MAG: HEPN domain-containing protein [Lachnospiraceae bacterium]|nr:HEPN domain-containing protein [Lachnospiraceae bacterium]